jgi:hypothetical protein
LGEAAAPQDDQDQSSADAAVAVEEGMDRLELDVGDRRLDRRR